MQLSVVGDRCKNCGTSVTVHQMSHDTVMPEVTGFCGYNIAELNLWDEKRARDLRQPAPIVQGEDDTAQTMVY